MISARVAASSVSGALGVTTAVVAGVFGVEAAPAIAAHVSRAAAVAARWRAKPMGNLPAIRVRGAILRRISRKKGWGRSAQAGEQIVFAPAPAVDGAEDPVERLPAPDRLVTLRGQVAELFVGGDL